MALPANSWASDELTARFAADLAALRPPPGKLGLAVSGGPDSLAMLLLARDPERFEAATVDHGLRADSAGEAAMVSQVCDQVGIAHETLTVTVADGNLQAEARTARYAALADWAERRGLAAILTAHHADDQAETLVMRLNRASGVSGLAGVRGRGRSPDGRALVLRPLLGWRKAELAAVVARAGVTPADDPSNRAERFDRARVRAALADADWLDVPALAASAAHLADADAGLAWAAAREFAENVERGPMDVTYRPQAPRAIALRVIARIVAELGEDAPRGSALAGVFDALLAGRPASLGRLVARPLAQGWSFSRAPARRQA